MLEDPSLDSTYLDVFPGSLVKGEKHPQKMPVDFFDTLKPISLHVLPQQAHTGEIQNQCGCVPLLSCRSFLFHFPEPKTERQLG